MSVYIVTHECTRTLAHSHTYMHTPTPTCTHTYIRTSAAPTNASSTDQPRIDVITHVRAWRSYSTTALLTPGYSLGFCAGMCLGLQLVTGFVLACWY